MVQQQPRLEREINIQTTSFNISENPNLCSCKQFRLGGDTITWRPHWMQVISGIKAAKPARQRRQLIEDDGELSRWVEFYRKSCVTLAVVSQMLVIMLVVYYICWGSWLSSKLILVMFQIKINQLTSWQAWYDKWIDTFNFCQKIKNCIFYLKCDLICSVVDWRFWPHLHSGILQVGVYCV